MLGLSEDAVNNFQNVEVYDDWVIVKDLRDESILPVIIPHDKLEMYVSLDDDVFAEVFSEYNDLESIRDFFETVLEIRDYKRDLYTEFSFVL